MLRRTFAAVAATLVALAALALPAQAADDAPVHHADTEMWW